MRDKTRHSVGVLLLLGVAATALGFAVLQFRELRHDLHIHPAAVLAGPGMFYGVIAACILLALAIAIIYADLLGRRLSPKATRVFQWALSISVLCLVLLPVAGHVWLDHVLYASGYYPCGADSWHRFSRLQWATSKSACDSQ